MARTHHLADRVPELLTVVAVVVALLLVRPFGDYPLGDDWTFALPLKHLLEDGRFEILDFTPMTLVSHIAWGALVSLPFGFSYDVARLSTVLLLLVEVKAILAILEDLGVASGVRAAAVLTLVFQPIHFFQSFQYASDVPCVAWTALSLLAYSRGLASSSPSLRWLATGSVFASLAFGVRQPGILIVVALGACIVLFERRILWNAKALAACFVVPAVSVSGWAYWYFAMRGSTDAYRDVSRQIGNALASMTVEGLLSVTFCVCATVASFVLPLAISVRVVPLARWRRIDALAAAAVFAVLFAITAVRYGTYFPYMRNNMTAFGLLSPNEMIVGDRIPVWPQGTDRIVGAAIAIALARLSWMVASVRFDAPAMRLAALLASIQLAWFIATSGFLFDRHLLQTLPAVIVVIAGACPRTTVRWAAFVPLVTISAAYAIVCTHDWHAISRTASAAARDLAREGVEERFVDAGYAETGWQMYDRSQQELNAGMPPLVRAGDSWWIRFVDRRVETRYVVSLSETMSAARWEHALAWWARAGARWTSVDAYVPYRELSYDSWWPYGRRPLWILRDTRTTTP